VSAAPHRSWAGPSTGRDEKAPLGGLSAATSRPPLRAIQSCPAPAPSSLNPNCRCRHPTGVQGLRWQRARHRRGGAPPCAGEELEEAHTKVGDHDDGSDEFYGGVVVATRGNLVLGGGDPLTCAGCSRGGSPSRACCPLLSVRWTAVVRVKLRRPPADAIQRMRNPRMQRPERDEVAGAQRRQPPLPLVHAPDAGATQPLLADDDRARRSEIGPPPMRHTARQHRGAPQRGSVLPHMSLISTGSQSSLVACLLRIRGGPGTAGEAGSDILTLRATVL
jgi:hypothetical protein